MSEKATITARDWEEATAGSQTEMSTEDGLQIKILQSGRVRTVLSESDPNKPIVIFISGTSESGKSTFGKLSVENNIAHRLKIYKDLAGLADSGYLPPMEKDPFTYATILENDPALVQKAADRIASDYVNIMQSTDVPIVIVETIKHKWIVDQFKANPQIRFLCVAVDADLDKRVSREALKTGKPEGEIRVKVIKKDEWKQQLGSRSVENEADIYILNNGEYTTYKQVVSSFLEVLGKNSRPYSGKTHDYSLD